MALFVFASLLTKCFHALFWLCQNDLHRSALLSHLCDCFPIMVHLWTQSHPKYTSLHKALSHFLTQVTSQVSYADQLLSIPTFLPYVTHTLACFVQAPLRTWFSYPSIMMAECHNWTQYTSLFYMLQNMAEKKKAWRQWLHELDVTSQVIYIASCLDPSIYTLTGDAATRINLLTNEQRECYHRLICSM